MQPLEKMNSSAVERNSGRSAPALSIEPLIADVRAAMADAEDLLKATAQHGGEALDDLRARTRESIRSVNQKLGDAQRSISAQARDAAKVTDHYVHDNPWTAIGIGAGVGLAAGLLLRRR